MNLPRTGNTVSLGDCAGDIRISAWVIRPSAEVSDTQSIEQNQCRVKQARSKYHMLDKDHGTATIMVMVLKVT